MSEYQYYEFLATDQPLSERQMRTLRAYSTRATITPTSFVNHYNWGNFKGKPSLWMEKYFDAFLYLANWGTRELMLRIPRRWLDLKTAKRYCPGERASARAKGDHVILDFVSETEDGDCEHNGQGLLSSIIPLRADIGTGDHRPLYLAWLLCAQEGLLKDDVSEPPCPPGLGHLSASLSAFADFLRIDRSMIEAAAAGSASREDSLSGGTLRRWISRLPAKEKDALLVRLAEDCGPRVRLELLQQFRKQSDAEPTPATSQVPRTVRDILLSARRICGARRRPGGPRSDRAADI